MDTFIVALPIFDNKMQVPLYELRCETATDALYTGNPTSGLNQSLSSAAIDVLNEVGLEPITGGQPIFVAFDEFSILLLVASDIKLDKSSIVATISKNIPATQSYIEIIWKLKLEGYLFAFDNYDGSPEYDVFLQMMDYISIDVAMPNAYQVLQMCKENYSEAMLICKNIKTMDSFDELIDSGFDLFTGVFYHQPITIKKKNIAPLKINAVQLLNIVNNDDFAIDEVTRIVSQDTALSVALLKLVNSPAVGVRQRVSSIRHAVVILGQKEFRKWATTIVTREMSFDKPSELVRLSLVRAKFAENLAGRMGLALQASNLFLTGLFSIIDIVLETTMDEALKILNASTPIKNALLGKQGPFSPVVDLIYSYEHADWYTVFRIMSAHNMQPADVNAAFVESLRWYKMLIDF